MIFFDPKHRNIAMYQIELNVDNLHNSIAFYTRLFNQKFAQLNFSEATFNLGFQELAIKEGYAPSNQDIHHLLVNNQEELGDTYERIKRYLVNGRPNPSCEKLDSVFGITDPDGHRWIIGTKQGLQSVDKQQVLFNPCIIQTFKP